METTEASPIIVGQQGKKAEAEIGKEETFNILSIPRKDDNAVFIDYDPMASLDKLIKLSNSSLPERLTYTKHLAELLGIIGDQSLVYISTILENIVQDNEEIQKALLGQFDDLIQFLIKKENGYKIIKNSLIPPLFILLGNTSIQIQEDAAQALAQVAEVLTEEDRGKDVLTKVLDMAHDGSSEDNRMVAVQLFGRMAQCFGVLCEQFVALEILSLGEDSQIRVRKEAVINMAQIGKIVSQEYFVTRLLPFYMRQAEQNTWGIRKACVDIINDISVLCDNKSRDDRLTPIMIKFLNDANRWVKISAYKNLGQFISTFQQGQVNEQLFKHFLKMTEHAINDLGTQDEIIISCAFNFPAVLYTCGKTQWEPLQKTFNTLLKNNNKSVKKPLACSFHEIARIIGQDQAEHDLLDVLENILRDTNDEVQYGAIQNLANFMEIFDDERKENLMDVFLLLQKDPKQWRIRELIANQIDKITEIFTPETVFRYIVPISFKLCNDTVSIVREKASKKIFSILNAFNNKEGEPFKVVVIQNINAFSASNRYNQRQTFTLMCQELMNFPEDFQTHFLPIMETLTEDKVSNVRISLAKVVAKHIQNKGQMANDPGIQRIVEILKKDKVRDVRSFFVKEDASPVKKVEESKESQLIKFMIQQQELDKIHSLIKDEEPSEPRFSPNQEKNASPNQIVSPLRDEKEKIQIEEVSTPSPVKNNEEKAGEEEKVENQVEASQEIVDNKGEIHSNTTEEAIVEQQEEIVEQIKEHVEEVQVEKQEEIVEVQVEKQQEKVEVSEEKKEEKVEVPEEKQEEQVEVPEVKQEEKVEVPVEKQEEKVIDQIEKQQEETVEVHVEKEEVKEEKPVENQEAPAEIIEKKEEIKEEQTEVPPTETDKQEENTNEIEVKANQEIAENNKEEPVPQSNSEVVNKPEEIVEPVKETENQLVNNQENKIGDQAAEIPFIEEPKSEPVQEKQEIIEENKEVQADKVETIVNTESLSSENTENKNTEPSENKEENQNPPSEEPQVPENENNQNEVSNPPNESKNDENSNN